MERLKIILVENDEDEQLFMREGFDAAGEFQIIRMVENGEALFESLKEEPHVLPDVILSDLNMPGKNGYDIISEVRSNPMYTHIPVIITSTSSTLSIINKCLAVGAADYLIKPETFNEYLPFAKELYKRILEKNLVR